jgi:F-type H+-transporting ATPase subunit c
MVFNESFVQGMKLLGAGLAMLGAIGAGAGVGIAASGGVQAMGRNPDAAGIIQTNMILGMALRGSGRHLRPGGRSDHHFRRLTRKEPRWIN